ncbi:lipocalin family protein [Methylomonas sp. AM2-LC]|uniref:lipocalin family protein n=1 Tax=Methylomonas sp. AM2-LC TaxID=3153301 RepID=UPI003265F847
MRTLLIFCTCLLTACTGIPNGIKPVTGFELNRYLGTWYEIARLDHRFERGLTDIRAEYSLNADGTVKVLNSGFNAEAGERQTAEGKAHFVSTADIGQLEVSFFEPFYGAYNIIALDADHYQYVMICGPDREYLWILARKPILAVSILQELLATANEYGFATDQLIFDVHNK